MKLAGIEYPSTFMNALREKNLAVFAGAGVSMGSPACLPTFNALAKEIARGTGEALGEGEPEDRFLGRLKADKGVEVHERAVEQLRTRCPRPTELHRDLLRLFPIPTSTRIVTTNFDLLFEQAAQQDTPVRRRRCLRRRRCRWGDSSVESSMCTALSVNLRGMDLAEDLQERRHWDADLWSAILRSWSTTRLDSSQYRRALRIVSCEALHKNHANSIADALLAIVRSTVLSDGLIEAADPIAVDLWDSVDAKGIPEECDDWLLKAWNHPAGVLMQFWLDSLAYWTSREGQANTHIERYMACFSKVIQEKTRVGRLGRCVLAGRLSMLLNIDEAGGIV